MKLRFLSTVCFSIFAVAIANGCSEDDGGSDDDDGAGASNSSGNSTSTGSGAGGDDTSSSTTTGASCDTTDPGGSSCGAPADCTIACDCGDFGVEAGGCADGACLSAADTCGEVCEGGFTGNYCFIGG